MAGAARVAQRHASERCGEVCSRPGDVATCRELALFSATKPHLLLSPVALHCCCWAVAYCGCAPVLRTGDAGVYRHHQDLFLFVVLVHPELSADPCVLCAGSGAIWRGATEHSGEGRRSRCSSPWEWLEGRQVSIDTIRTSSLSPYSSSCKERDRGRR